MTRKFGNFSSFSIFSSNFAIFQKIFSKFSKIGRIMANRIFKFGRFGAPLFGWGPPHSSSLIYIYIWQGDKTPPKFGGVLSRFFSAGGGFVQIDIGFSMKLSTKKHITGFQCRDKTPQNGGRRFCPVNNFLLHYFLLKSRQLFGIFRKLLLHSRYSI